VTAIASQTTGWSPIGNQTELPPGADIGLKASAQVGKGQAAFFAADGTGYVALNDGTVPALVCAGVGADELSQPIPTVDGGASVRLWSGLGTGQAGATTSGDAMVTADVLVPLFDSGNGVPGKLSNLSGNDRSFMGVGLGLNDLGYPIAWVGRIASAFGRMLHSLINESAGSVGYAADASATTDLGSLTGGTALLTIGFVIPRPKRRVQISAVEIIPSATQALAATNYRVVQIWKVDTTGTVALASSPLVATFSTLTQNLTAGQPTQFALGASSALLLRETDILVGTSVHTASGVALPQSAIRALCKVI
jgi:hypothetical protein